MEQRGKKNSCNVLIPERVRAHRFSSTPIREAVSRYRTPIAGTRQQLLHNVLHSHDWEADHDGQVVFDTIDTGKRLDFQSWLQGRSEAFE
jgi:hypothetical protein